MDKVPSETLVESSRFPVGLVSEKSAGEKVGGGRPPYWEMVFWWTRKPLVGARAIIAGALVSSSISESEFDRVLRLNEKSPHRHNSILPEGWRKSFEGKSLLDPFAGFGSIPLEALRLGLSKVVAVELLPTCYVFLKAVLEYPLKHGKQLVEDVEKWGNWISEQLRQDPLIQQLYEPDVAVYIGSWEIKCPICDKWTILVGNWWLARVAKKKGQKKTYTRVAWIKPKIKDGKVLVEVADLNVILKGKLDGINIDAKRGLVVSADGKMFEVPKSKIDSKKQVAVCLHCNNAIRHIDLQTGKHFSDSSKLPKQMKKELVWYVRHALRRYHEGDPSLAKPVLLIKVKIKEKDLEFEPCTSIDQEKLEDAKQEIEKMIQQKDPDIPKEPIPEYENRRITPILGVKRWHQFFNPRQLLVLVKLVKLIREAGKRIEEEKVKEGLNREEARAYAEAVATYLAVVLCKYADYNSISTSVHSSNPRGVDSSSTLSTRGIAMKWNWCSINPIVENDHLSGIFQNSGAWNKCIRGVIRGTNYLTLAFHNPQKLFLLPEAKQDNIRVVLDDATILGNLDSNEKFDLIVTDPPYYDDVPYTELSDFYYVWLKRALSNVDGGKLVPKFLPEAFFKQVGAKLIEIKTQWQEFAKKEVSVNPGRFENMKNRVGTAVDHFLNLLTRSFIVMRKLLDNDGLLETYYAHTSPDAWIALLEAGWRSGNFHIVNAFPLATESLQRVTARGKYALDTSIVVAWRKGTSGSTSVQELYDRFLREARIAALELIKAGRKGSDLFVGTMTSILSAVTRYKKLYSPMGVLDVKSLVTEYVYPATAKALAMALGEFAGTPGEIKRPESLFYLITKALFPKPEKAKRKLDRTNIALLSIGTKADIYALQKLIILRKEKEKFYLEEPATADRKSLEELLQKKGITPAKPTIESPIDALHLLEYYALTLPLKPFLTRFSQLKEEYGSEVEEAINIAAILAKTLPATDPEKKACQEIIARIKGEKLA